MKQIARYYYKSIVAPIIPKDKYIKNHYDIHNHGDDIKYNFNYITYLIRNKYNEKLKISLYTLWNEIENPICTPIDYMINDQSKAIMYSKHQRRDISEFAKIMMKIKNPYFKNIEIDSYRLDQLLSASYYKKIDDHKKLTIDKQYDEHLKNIYGIVRV